MRFAFKVGRLRKCRGTTFGWWGFQIHEVCFQSG